MSYIKANVTSEYDNNQVNVEQLQSVTPYATNVTVVESQSMDLATNVRLIESHPIYSHSNAFNWTAIDEPSEMNYDPDLFPCLCDFICCMNSDDQVMRRSQKLKITDTHVDYEHNATSCCCLSLLSGHKVKHHISLDHIWMMRYYAPNQQFDLLTFGKGGDKCVSIRGLIKSSNTPKLIKDTIIQRRPRKTQTKSHMIPHITSTFKSETISLIPETNIIDLKNVTKGYFQVAFVDDIGSVDKTAGSTLEFWSPPIGRNRSDSYDSPDMTACFQDDKSCITFKKAVEDSRDSFK